MSKIGRQPVLIPPEVNLQVEGQTVLLKGPQGELKFTVPPRLVLKLDEKQLTLSPRSHDRQTRALWGTWRSLLANAVQGVRQGWQKTLQVVGTGYKVRLEGQDLVFQVGFSHPVRVKPPQGINFQVNGDLVVVKGVDRQLVGEIAAQIRRIHPPDAYKGKGIRYQGEVVKLKPGKMAKTGA